MTDPPSDRESRRRNYPAAAANVARLGWSLVRWTAGTSLRIAHRAYWLALAVLRWVVGTSLRALHRAYWLTRAILRRSAEVPARAASAGRRHVTSHLRLAQHEPRTLRVPDRYRQASYAHDAPVISIVTPSLDQGAYLERTVRSVLEQEYPRLEYIVRDGGSTDGSAAVLERYDQFLHHWASVPDRGQAAAINAGFEHATGEILAYLNSDDMLLPGTLAFVARYFVEHPDVDVIYGHRVIVDEEDREIGRWVLPRHDRHTLMWADFVPQETLFWRREIWDRTGGRLDESLKFAIDWDMLLRFADAGARMKRIPRLLSAFRVHDAQKTAKWMHDIGQREMQILRERTHGRPISQAEVDRALWFFVLRQYLYHVLGRTPLLRY